MIREPNSYELPILEYLLNKSDPIQIKESELPNANRFHWGVMVGSKDNVENILANLVIHGWITKNDKKLCKLTELGKEIIKEFLNKRASENLEKETERHLKWYELQGAKQMFEDYPIIKKQKRNAYIITITSTLIALASLLVAIQQYLKCQ